MNQWGVIWSVRDSFIAGLFATLELFITAAGGADYRYCAVLF